MRVFSQLNKYQQKNKTKPKQKKGVGAPLSGLAKSIYYVIDQNEKNDKTTNNVSMQVRNLYFPNN